MFALAPFRGVTFVAGFTDFESWGDRVKRISVFIIILLGCWLVIPPSAFAVKERLIAVVMANSMPRYQEIHTVFVEKSRSFCGDDCKIYVQRPNPDIMSLRNSVRKAVALGADLIVTYGPMATLAAKAETTNVPTLFADVYDPVRLGLVSEKIMTGRNMTGVRGDAPVQTLYKYFVEAVKPGKLVVLYDADSPDGNLQKELLLDVGNKRGVEIVPLAIDASKDHAAMMASIPADADGLFLANSEHANSQLNKVLAFAAERHLPVITQRAGMSEMGAFMVLETSGAEQGERLAEMAAQIFAGTKVVDIPMLKPHRVGFIVNLKISKDYAIQVPFQTLSVATRIVR